MASETKHNIDLTADPETFSYKNQLPHQALLLLNQMEAGLTTVRRAFRFLHKIGNSQLKFANEFSDIVQTENSKTPRKNAPKDAQYYYIDCNRMIIDYSQELSTRNKTFAEELMSKIVEPLAKFHQEMDKKHSEYNKVYNSKTKEIDSQIKELDNLRNNALNIWKDLVAVQNEFSKLSPEEKREVIGWVKKQERGVALEEKKTSLKEKAIIAFQKFEARCNPIVDNVSSWYGIQFPQWLADMQSFEDQRLALLKSSFDIYHKLAAAYNQPLTFPSNFEKRMEPLDPQGNIANQVMQWVFERGVATTPPQPAVLMPCTSTDLQNGDAWVQHSAKKLEGETYIAAGGKLGL